MDRPVTGFGPTNHALPDPDESSAAAPVSTLRGARIEVDGRRVGRVFLVACLVALAALSSAFFIVGAHKNAQISELHANPARVVVTVVTCRGLMGGSGSNGAGYACTGTFTLAGHRFREAIPGSTLYAPQTRIVAVAAGDGSGLFTLPRLLADEQSSWRVYILPSVLLVALVLLLGTLLLKRRSRHFAERAQK